MKIKLKIGKKAQTLKNYIIALLIFSLAITGFIIVPNAFDENRGLTGFWAVNGYTLPGNNISDLSQLNPTQQLIKDISCNINPEPDTCGVESTNPFGLLSNFINLMVQGGYSALVTIMRSIGLGSDILYGTALIIGVPSVIVEVLVSVLFVSIIIAVLFLIFNRSDSG